MSIVYPTSGEKQEYVDPTAMPAHIPKVAELGTSSAPLKSAAFFIGAYCKEYNGAFANSTVMNEAYTSTEDFVLCKAEDRNPEHCLKEGRRVTRCATDLCVMIHQA
ncbi:hypothetical protein C0991_006537 [Blastosporella zonata]|nr:hypothetical protein C0991_006537 [Blastosporella zonata]